MALTSRKMASTVLLLVLVILEILTAHALPPGNKSNEDWPEQCNGKYYCQVETQTYKNLQTTFDRLLRGETFKYILGNETTHRDGLPLADDVASCRTTSSMDPITMIKDEMNVIWYVARTDKFKIDIEINECSNNGVRVWGGLDKNELKRNKVYCQEQKFDISFFVLSQDKQEIVSLSPHQGLPLYCSAKILK